MTLMRFSVPAALLIGLAGVAPAQTPDILFDDSTTFEDLFPSDPAAAVPQAVPMPVQVAPDYLARCLADPGDAQSCYLAQQEAGGDDGPRFESTFFIGGAPADETPAAPTEGTTPTPTPVAVTPQITEAPPPEATPSLAMVETVIQFGYDSDVLEVTEFPKIDRIATALTSSEASAASFVIVGHTDSVGSDWYNCDLSLRRARALTVALTDRGVAPSRLAAIGAGEHLPRNQADTTAAENRRVGFAPLGEDPTATLDELSAFCGG